MKGTRDSQGKQKIQASIQKLTYSQSMARLDGVSSWTQTEPLRTIKENPPKRASSKFQSKAKDFFQFYNEKQHEKREENLENEKKFLETEITELEKMKREVQKQHRDALAKAQGLESTKKNQELKLKMQIMQNRIKNLEIENCSWEKRALNEIHREKRMEILRKMKEDDKFAKENNKALAEAKQTRLSEEVQRSKELNFTLSFIGKQNLKEIKREFGEKSRKEDKELMDLRQKNQKILQKQMEVISKRTKLEDQKGKFGIMRERSLNSLGKYSFKIDQEHKSARENKEMELFLKDLKEKEEELVRKRKYYETVIRESANSLKTSNARVKTIQTEKGKSVDAILSERVRQVAKNYQLSRNEKKIETQRSYVDTFATEETQRSEQSGLVKIQESKLEVFIKKEARKGGSVLFGAISPRRNIGSRLIERETGKKKGEAASFMIGEKLNSLVSSLNDEKKQTGYSLLLGENEQNETRNGKIEKENGDLLEAENQIADEGNQGNSKKEGKEPILEEEVDDSETKQEIKGC